MCTSCGDKGQKGRVTGPVGTGRYFEGRWREPPGATRGLQTVGEGVVDGGPAGLAAPGREGGSERPVRLGRSDWAGAGWSEGGQRSGPQWRGPRGPSLGRWLCWEEDGGSRAEESDRPINVERVTSGALGRSCGGSGGPASRLSQRAGRDGGGGRGGHVEVVGNGGPPSRFSGRARRPCEGAGRIRKGSSFCGPSRDGRAAWTPSAEAGRGLGGRREPGSDAAPARAAAPVSGRGGREAWSSPSRNSPATGGRQRALGSKSAWCFRVTRP